MKFNIGLAEFILEKMQLGLFQLKSICSQNQQPPWQKSFWAPHLREVRRQIPNGIRSYDTHTLLSYLALLS